jgi:hypothetical protein
LEQEAVELLLLVLYLIVQQLGMQTQRLLVQVVVMLVVQVET